MHPAALFSVPPSTAASKQQLPPFFSLLCVSNPASSAASFQCSLSLSDFLFTEQSKSEQSKQQQQAKCTLPSQIFSLCRSHSLLSLTPCTLAYTHNTTLTLTRLTPSTHALSLTPAQFAACGEPQCALEFAGLAHCRDVKMTTPTATTSSAASRSSDLADDQAKLPPPSRVLSYRESTPRRPRLHRRPTVSAVPLQTS